MGFPDGSAAKESACNAGDLDLIPGSGRSLGEGNSYPLHYAGLQNSGTALYSPWGHQESDTTEQLSQGIRIFETCISKCNPFGNHQYTSVHFFSTS